MLQRFGILLAMLFGCGCSGSTESSFVPEGSTDLGELNEITGSGEEGGEGSKLCLLPQAAGSCEGAFPAFWFSSEVGECLEFTYGGCEGNENRFETFEECEAACKGSGGSETSGSETSPEEGGEETSAQEQGGETTAQEEGGETSAQEEGGEQSDSPYNGIQECIEIGCADSLPPCVEDSKCLEALECIRECGEEVTCVDDCIELDLSSLDSPLGNLAACMAAENCLEATPGGSEGEAGEEGSEQGGQEGDPEIVIPAGVDPECYLECVNGGESLNYCIELCRIEPEEGGTEPGEEGGTEPGEEGGSEGGDPGYCTDICGMEFPGPGPICFCDVECVEYGDCCPDACAVCGYCTEGQNPEGGAEEGGPQEEGGEEGGNNTDFFLGGTVCFMPEWGIGAGSYHFDTPTTSYISYENPPSGWLLDNGESFPGKKYFTQVETDAFTKSITAFIDWQVDQDTTVQGAASWSYEMIFADDLSSIEDGVVYLYATFGFQIGSASFPDDLPYTCFQGE